MRALLLISFVLAALGGQQKPSDLYASAIAKYVAGDDDAAFDMLARVPHADVQKELEASLMPFMSGSPGTTAARRRLEAISMLHTEYALLGGLTPKEVTFQIDMAHFALSVARLTLAGKDPAQAAEKRGMITDIPVPLETAHVREFVPRWTALAASVVLTSGSDQQATTLVDEALKLLPDNQELLFWRGLVMEFQAVWVGVPSANVQAAVPGMSSRDGAGFNMLANTRTWAPIVEAYRRALARDPDNPETHLHLGYVLYSLRNYGPAKSEYEMARDRSTDAFVVYVANLLLARLKEDQNDLAGAVDDYQRALAAMPRAQSAYIGLGMVEGRLGHSDRARNVTMRLAAIPAKERTRDPWWAFHTSRIPEQDLDWLRKAVRQ